MDYLIVNKVLLNYIQIEINIVFHYLNNSLKDLFFCMCEDYIHTVYINTKFVT